MFAIIIIILILAIAAVILGWREAYSRGYQAGHDRAWHQSGGHAHELPPLRQEVQP